MAHLIYLYISFAKSITNNHVICEINRQIGLSYTDRPLSHRLASLAQIGLSHTDWTLLHLRSDHTSRVREARMSMKSARLAPEQERCDRRPICAREAGLCKRGRSVQERQIFQSHLLGERGESCCEISETGSEWERCDRRPICAREAVKISLFCTDQPLPLSYVICAREAECERGHVRERPCSLIGWDRSHE